METHTETRDCKVDSRVESRELLYAAQKDHRAYPCSTGRAHREEFKDERRERCSLRDSHTAFHAHNFHCRHVTVNNVPLLFNARHTYFVYLSLFFFLLCVHITEHPDMLRERDTGKWILLIWKFSAGI